MSTSHDAARRLAILIGEVCDVPPDRIDQRSRLLAYGLDSVRATELIVLIENEFGVQLQLGELQDVQTVADLRRQVEASLAQVVLSPEGRGGAGDA